MPTYPESIRSRRLRFEPAQAMAATQHNREQAICHVSNEIFWEIFDNLHVDAQCTVRLSCSLLNDRSLPMFGQLFVNLTVHIYLKASLDKLEAIANSRVAPYVRCLRLVGFHFDCNPNAPEIASARERFGTDKDSQVDFCLYRELLKEQHWLTDYGKNLRLISRIIQKLPNCSGLSIADHDRPLDYIDLHKTILSLMKKDFRDSFFSGLPVAEFSSSPVYPKDVSIPSDPYNSSELHEFWLESEEFYNAALVKGNVFEPPHDLEMSRFTMALFTLTKRPLDTLNLDGYGCEAYNFHFTSPLQSAARFARRVRGLRELGVSLRVGEVNDDFLHFLSRAENLTKLELELSNYTHHAQPSIRVLIRKIGAKMHLPHLRELLLATNGIGCLVKPSMIVDILRSHAKPLKDLVLRNLPLEDSFVPCVKFMAEEMSLNSVTLANIDEHQEKASLTSSHSGVLVDSLSTAFGHACRHPCADLRYFEALHDTRAKLLILAEKLSNEHDNGRSHTEAY